MTKKDKKLSCYEPLPREPQKSFQTFLKHRNSKPHERTLKNTAIKILKENGLTETDKTWEDELKKEISRLTTLSSKWCWTERIKIYDADKQLELARKREDTFDGLNSILLDNVEGIIKYANNLLGEVIRGAKKENGEPYSLITRIKMLKDVNSLLKEAYELLCNLCGRPYEYQSMDFNGLIDVNAEVVETKSTIELISEVDKEFADLYDNNNRTDNTNE